LSRVTSNATPTAAAAPTANAPTAAATVCRRDRASRNSRCTGGGSAAPRARTRSASVISSPKSSRSSSSVISHRQALAQSRAGFVQVEAHRTGADPHRLAGLGRRETAQVEEREGYALLRGETP